MKKKRIIILGILVLGLILTVSLMSINSLQKQKSEDSPTETAKDIFQSEEQADTEVEFSDLDNQQDKDSDKTKDPEQEKNPEQEKEPEQEKDPESGGNTGNSGNDELWTGFY